MNDDVFYRENIHHMAKKITPDVAMELIDAVRYEDCTIELKISFDDFLYNLRKIELRFDSYRYQNESTDNKIKNSLINISSSLEKLHAKLYDMDGVCNGMEDHLLRYSYRNIDDDCNDLPDFPDDRERYNNAVGEVIWLSNYLRKASSFSLERDSRKYINDRLNEQREMFMIELQTMFDNAFNKKASFVDEGSRPIGAWPEFCRICYKYIVDNDPVVTVDETETTCGYDIVNSYRLFKAARAKVRLEK